MECCQPLCSAGQERCPLPMVLTEAVPVCPCLPPGFGRACLDFPARFPPSFLPPFQGSTLFNSYPRVPPFRLHPRLDSGAASRLKRRESRLAADGTSRTVCPYWERATSSSVLTVNNGRKSRQNDRRAMLPDLPMNQNVPLRQSCLRCTQN